MKLKQKVTLGIGALFVIVLALLMLPAVILGPSSSATALAATCGSTDPMSPTAAIPADASGLSGEQVGNARIIIGIGQSLGASAYEVKLAVWTAYHESALINLTYGSGDSLGLFQQTHFWGTAEQRLNPDYASTRFYSAVFAYRATHSLTAQDGPVDYLNMAVAIQKPLRPLSLSYLSPKHNFLSWEPLVDSLLELVGVNTPQNTQNGAVFETSCSATTDLGIPGKVIIAPGANNPGQPVKSETLNFLARVAGIYGKPLICTTGTNHSIFSVDGLVSDHTTGNACDFGMIANGGFDDSPIGDAIATACLEAAGISLPAASLDAQLGGLYTIPGSPANGNLRVQCIWKTFQGGNHHNHVHIGARPENSG